MKQEKSLEEKITENDNELVKCFKGLASYAEISSRRSMTYGFFTGMAGIEALNLFIDGHYVLGAISSAVTLFTGAISINARKNVIKINKDICDVSLNLYMEYDKCYNYYKELTLNNSQWEKAYNSLQKENNQWQEAYNQLKSQNTQLRNIMKSKSFENRVNNTWANGNKVEKKPN